MGDPASQLSYMRALRAQELLRNAITPHSKKDTEIEDLLQEVHSTIKQVLSTCLGHPYLHQFVLTSVSGIRVAHTLWLRKGDPACTSNACIYFWSTYTLLFKTLTDFSGLRENDEDLRDAVPSMLARECLQSIAFCLEKSWKLYGEVSSECCQFLDHLFSMKVIYGSNQQNVRIGTVSLLSETDEDHVIVGHCTSALLQAAVSSKEFKPSMVMTPKERTVALNVLNKIPSKLLDERPSHVAAFLPGVTASLVRNMEANNGKSWKEAVSCMRCLSSWLIPCFNDSYWSKVNGSRTHRVKESAKRTLSEELQGIIAREAESQSIGSMHPLQTPGQRDKEQRPDMNLAWLSTAETHIGPSVATLLSICENSMESLEGCASLQCEILRLYHHCGLTLAPKFVDRCISACLVFIAKECEGDDVMQTITRIDKFVHELGMRGNVSMPVMDMLRRILDEQLDCLFRPFALSTSPRDVIEKWFLTATLALLVISRIDPKSQYWTDPSVTHQRIFKLLCMLAEPMDDMLTSASVLEARYDDGAIVQTSSAVTNQLYKAAHLDDFPLRKSFAYLDNRRMQSTFSLMTFALCLNGLDYITVADMVTVVSTPDGESISNAVEEQTVVTQAQVASLAKTRLVVQFETAEVLSGLLVNLPKAASITQSQAELTWSAVCIPWVLSQIQGVTAFADHAAMRTISQAQALEVLTYATRIRLAHFHVNVRSATVKTDRDMLPGHMLQTLFPVLYAYGSEMAVVSASARLYFENLAMLVTGSSSDGAIKGLIEDNFDYIVSDVLKSVHLSGHTTFVYSLLEALFTLIKPSAVHYLRDLVEQIGDCVHRQPDALVSVSAMRALRSLVRSIRQWHRDDPALLKVAFAATNDEGDISVCTTQQDLTAEDLARQVETSSHGKQGSKKLLQLLVDATLLCEDALMSRSYSLRIIALSVIGETIGCLGESESDGLLLPLIHTSWQSMAVCLCSPDLRLVRNTAQVMECIVKVAPTFTKQKFLSDALDTFLTSFCNRLLDSSLDMGLSKDVSEQLCNSLLHVLEVIAIDEDVCDRILNQLWPALIDTSWEKSVDGMRIIQFLVDNGFSDRLWLLLVQSSPIHRQQIESRPVPAGCVALNVGNRGDSTFNCTHTDERILNQIANVVEF
eukprot:Clim_evm23s134 gene=Clim_evmTU23s134